MKTINERSAQDPEKINLILEDAAKNPQAFLQSLPAEQQAKIRSIAEDVNAKKLSSKTKP